MEFRFTVMDLATKSTPKVQAWIWKAAHMAVPTRHALASRGISPSMTCPRCGAASEDISHLILHCPKSSSLWALVWAKMQIRFTPRTLNEWWETIYSHNIGSGVVKEVRQAWLTYTSWRIWIDRNDVLFNNDGKPIEVMFQTIHSLVLEQLSSTSIEASVDELSRLVDWGLRPIVCADRLLSGTDGSPHCLGMSKINFNGARKPGNPKAGAGFIVRSWTASLLAAAAIPAYEYDINIIEMLGAWNALVWTSSKFGSSPVWIEGDSKSVIDELQHAPHSDDDPILADCKLLISGFEACRISHIYREGNTGADFMANHGCIVESYIVWESHFPEDLLVCVERDVRAPFVRL